MRVLIFLLSIIGGLALFALALFIFQRHLIYHPRSYDERYDFHQFKNIIELEYQTSEGKQISFYLPPKTPSNQPPETLWVLFGGNGSLALDWYDFIRGYPDSQAGILLIEYPGYGKCEGNASPETMLASTEKAIDRLAEYLAVHRNHLESNLHILGHSLGTGSGLQFAIRHPVKHVVLVSPFTSLQEMACRVVGKPLCYLLRHHFDNEHSLSELSKRSSIPQVHIIHGTLDRVVPVAMGRDLAKRFVPMVTYLEIPNADHNFIFSFAQEAIYKIMQNPTINMKKNEIIPDQTKRK